MIGFRQRWHSWAAAVGYIFLAGCGMDAGCTGQLQPLPESGLPSDQTIEGGIQVRVTRSGFQNLQDVIVAVIDDALGTGMCVGRVEQSLLVADVEVCYTNDYCDGDAQGCQVNFTLTDINMSVPDTDTFHVDVTFDVDTVIPSRLIDPLFDLQIGHCDMTMTITDGWVGLDIEFLIDEQTGELDIQLQNLDVNLTGFDAGNCGIIDDIFDFVVDLMSSSVGNFLIDLLTPLLQDTITSFLPDPLGIAGLVDAGALLSGLSPGTRALLEARLVPGGYVSLPSAGLSVGMITGFNADQDPSTREPDNDNEPARCVPPLPAPDFAAAPHLLPVHNTRGNFQLAPADEFLGIPADPATDLILGLSETFLDLTGHHLVTSGAMCLGVGTELIPQLNLGIIAPLVPSLAELGSERGDDPLLLVIRPTSAVDFDIGDGTKQDPSVTVHLNNLQIDFYAFLHERYVRGFTIALTVDAGLNFEFTVDDQGNPAVEPVLLGLDADQLDLTVHNAEFLRKTPEELEELLPGLFDLALPLITEGIGAITLPGFGGFTVGDVEITKIVTGGDTFLGLYASLVPTATMRAQLAVPGGAVDRVLRDAPQPVSVATRARIVSLHTPAPSQLQRWLAHEGGELTTVVLEVDAQDPLGRPFEWTWRPAGGLWRPYTTARQQAISERAFVVQGHHTIEIKARAVGEFRTVDRTPEQLSFTTDSMGPRLLYSQIAADDHRLVTPAHDLVLPDDTIEYAYGSPGTDQPGTSWRRGGSLAMDRVLALHRDGVIVVYARDELGNTTIAAVDIADIIEFHGRPDTSGGCDCRASGSRGGTSGALLVLLVVGTIGGAPLLRRLRSTQTLLNISTAIIAIVIAGCSGSRESEPQCELDQDCAAGCPAQTLPICYNNECVCADDIRPGVIGSHSEVAVSTSGTAWVSAYNEKWGDLMVARWPEAGRIPLQAWAWVDGVPDIAPALPQSDIRGGITKAGDDVGRHTDIAVSTTDVVMVSYYDATHGALRFASNASGQWLAHTVDTGSVGGDPELGFERAGEYTSIIIDRDTGIPSIAYFAQISDGQGVLRTELRFATARTAQPLGPSDWSFELLDSAAIVPDSQQPYTVPEGVGLFVQAATAPDGSAVVVYYDRIAGALKLVQQAEGRFSPPLVVDGGEPNEDVGWYPSVVVDDAGTVHIAYVDAINDDLKYYNTLLAEPELVDDGYRIDGTTEAGLPLPVFHLVGDDSAVVLTTHGPVIAYQDATTHELLLAQRFDEGSWQVTPIAGNEQPFAGAYGFYTSATYDGDAVVMSSWVVDKPANEFWVEIFRRSVVIE